MGKLGFRLSSPAILLPFVLFLNHQNNVVYGLYISTQSCLCGNRITNSSFITENLVISWCENVWKIPEQMTGIVLISPHWLGREAYLTVSSAEIVDSLSDWVKCLFFEALCWCHWWDGNVLCQILLLAVHGLVH